jgi:hypothetical protein
MKSLTLTILVFIISLNGISQLTYVPDDNFEELIEKKYSNASNGVVNDNYVLTSGLVEVDGISFGSNISDLTGLQDFPNLVKLVFFTSTLEKIDLSNITLHTSNINNNIGNGINISYCNYLKTVSLPHGEYDIWINGPYISKIDFPSDVVLQKCNIIGCGLLSTFDISSTSDVKLNSYLQILGNVNLNCIKLNNGKCNKWANVEIEGNNAKCIQVDDPSFCQVAENVNTWGWDGYSISSNQYSTNCSCIAGIEEQETNKYNLAPNPTSSDVKIILTQDQLGKSFKLFDNIGREKMSGLFNSTEYTLNLESFEAGIYFLKIADEDAQIKIAKN